MPCFVCYLTRLSFSRLTFILLAALQLMPLPEESEPTRCSSQTFVRAKIDRLS